MKWQTKDRLKTLGKVAAIITALSLWAIALFLLYVAMKPLN